VDAIYYYIYVFILHDIKILLSFLYNAVRVFDATLLIIWQRSFVA